jgi:glycosyltransferase involved in cell wall biosynthesis
MAMGKAVVLTRIKSLFETGLESFKNCVLVKPGDVKDMQEKIQFLLDNPGEARKIGKNARRFAEEKHGSEKYAKGIAEVLWKVYGEKF